jgi:hypothetical protein
LGGRRSRRCRPPSGAGYGEGFGANSHRFAPTGMLAAVKYLVEELGADVNAADHEGHTALHHAASRGDNEMILYLVSKGANVKAVDREGERQSIWPTGPCSAFNRFPRPSPFSKSSEQRITISASPVSRALLLSPFVQPGAGTGP